MSTLVLSSAPALVAARSGRPFSSIGVLVVVVVVAVVGFGLVAWRSGRGRRQG